MSATQAADGGQTGFSEDGLKDRLRAYMEGQTGQKVEIGKWKRFPVGFSWITYGFDATYDGRKHELILRLGPSDGLFAPYSAKPQYLVLKALHGTGVAVPEAFWYSDDPSILGLPFFICEKAEGEAPIPWGSAGEGFPKDYRETIGRQFVEQLAALHNFDWRNSELVEWDAGHSVDDVALREVEYWAERHAHWALRPYPMAYRAIDWLRSNLPKAPRVSVVHGDYRIGNFLEKDNRITAILDWELAHLGDPLEDIGWAFLPQYMGGSGLICRLVERGEFLRLYNELTGIEVDEKALNFYTILAQFKVGMTFVAGVSCFEDGSFHDMRMPAMGTQIFATFRQIEKMIEAAS
ncbi:MAG: phosphotransferase family protein [Rhodobiaceae bacterium]|nr:phosphotransferase family protein [Rhodobiaceae bacterium]MCC0054545.1 phosphotransferase family protein [Rhodobiaceae bacterium]